MKKEQIEKAMKQAKASLEIEGYSINKEQSELVRAKLAGEITEKEFSTKLDNLISRENNIEQ